MGNEMGNNNTTSALNEEDNVSEAEKKALNEEVTAESMEEENQKISAAKGSDGETKADGLASNDKSEPGKETSKGDTLGEGEKGNNQTTPMSEARCQIEEAAMASDDATIEPGKDTLEEDNHADDVKGPNQIIPTANAENVEEKARGLTTVESTIMLENDSPKSDTHGDVVIEENQMPPADDAEDVLNNNTSFASNDVPSGLENAVQEVNAFEDDENGDHRNHLSTAGEIVQEKAARIDLDDRKCELQDKTETHDNDEPGENATDPVFEDLNVLGKAADLSSDDQPKVKDSFSYTGHQIAEIIQADKSPNDGLADKGGENCETLPNFSLESNEEYDKQIDLCTDQLDKESSIKQEEENTVGLNCHGVELQELSQIHSFHDESDEVLEESSLQHSESLQRSDLPDTDTLLLMDDDISSDKEKETQEKMLCGVSTEGGDGDELGSSERCASEITDNFSSINGNSNHSLLAEVNHITDHSVDSPPESDMIDKQLKFDSEKIYKDLQEERKLKVSGSEMGNSQDFEADIINRRCNGDCNGEGDIVPAWGFYGIGETDQVEEPEVTENGHQFDVCINNNTTSDEISTGPVQQGFMVPEAEGDGLNLGSTVVNCRIVQEGNYEDKILEEIEKKPEALKGSDENMSEQCNLGQKESHSLQNSFSSMLHISSHQEDNVGQTKSFTFTSLQVSDLKQRNGGKSLGATGNNFDSSNLTMPALEMVDNEAFEKEEKDYSQLAEETSVKEAKITTSEANMSIVPILNSPVFANGGYEVMESTTRYSTESNPENPNISCLMQKSPSFNLNLRMEATKEESDHFPLLHQGKTATESSSNQSSLNLKPCSEYEQRTLQHEEMPVEEKIVTMERSYSDKFHAPFLGLLREEEEAHLIVMPKKQENQDDDTAKEVKEMEYALPKGKEKRKPRPSFFSSCMCCMTLTN